MTKTIKKEKIMWIAWEKHRRTIGLCKYFNIDLITYVSNLNRFIKHPIFAIKTILEIYKQRPQVLIVQNPSILLTLITCLFKRIFGYKLVVDTHNAGILPEKIILKLFSFLYKYFQKKADITIVTNRNLADIVISNRGIPFIMPDRLPDTNMVLNSKTLNGKYNIACICTFGMDEPYEQLVEAAGYFDKNIHFYVTGNFEKLSKKKIHMKPENVIFTGFLPDNDYWGLLFYSDLIIDLTTRENCLVCGAYEAVAVGVPIILSDTQALRDYFYKGTVFTNNTTEDIVSNVNLAINNIDKLKNDVIDLKAELEVTWGKIGGDFEHCIFG